MILQQNKQNDNEKDSASPLKTEEIISILNKLTADVVQAKLHLKENYFHDELRVYPIYCKINDPNERPEVSVYLNIYDKKNNDKLFAGWMLKTLPSVSSLEHPLYDIWINDCI